MTRWVTDHESGHSRWYIDRFRRMAADGADLAGEARLLDAVVRREARILDAGCGTGRVGAELAARGHSLVGVDVDPELIAAASDEQPVEPFERQRDHPWALKLSDGSGLDDHAQCERNPRVDLHP